MTIEGDDERINDADTKMDRSLIKLAEQYASCDRRSADLNDERATIRDNAEKLGIPSKSFQHAVGMVKHMSEGERRDYQIGVNRVLKAISDRQNDLFPDEAEKIRKREDAKKPTGKEGAPDPDTNPRSDPDAGGAKPQMPWPDDQMAAATGNPPGEQEAGDEALEAAAPELAKATKKPAAKPATEPVQKLGKESQSEKSKKKLAAAGLN